MTTPDLPPGLPTKERLREIRNVPLQKDDLAVDCSKPGVFLRVHPNAIGKSANHPAFSYFREIEAVREPAKDQPASGEGFVWMDESYPVATESATQPPTGVEARVCGWQPIESAPGKPGWYLGSFDGALRCVGYDSAGWGFWDTPSDQRIEALTHWQPLPQPPEGGPEKP